MDAAPTAAGAVQATAEELQVQEQEQAVGQEPHVEGEPGGEQQDGIDDAEPGTVSGSSAGSGSDSDDESGGDGDDEHDEIMRDAALLEDNNEDKLVGQAPRTKNEIDTDNLPVDKVAEGEIAADANLFRVGSVRSMIGNTIVIQALPTSSALDQGNILCYATAKQGDVAPSLASATELGARPLGRVDDIFGPISQPLYVVRVDVDVYILGHAQREGRARQQRERHSQSLECNIYGFRSPIYANPRLCLA